MERLVGLVDGGGRKDSGGDDNGKNGRGGVVGMFGVCGDGDWSSRLGNTSIPYSPSRSRRSYPRLKLLESSRGG